MSDREMYIGGVFMIAYGIALVFLSPVLYYYDWVIGAMLIIIGSIMVGNYNQGIECFWALCMLVHILCWWGCGCFFTGERMKYEWREGLIVLLAQNLSGISNQFNVSFSIERYPIFNLVLRITFLNAVALQTGGQPVQTNAQVLQTNDRQY